MSSYIYINVVMMKNWPSQSVSTGIFWTKLNYLLTHFRCNEWWWIQSFERWYHWPFTNYIRWRLFFFTTPLVFTNLPFLFIFGISVSMTQNKRLLYLTNTKSIVRGSCRFRYFNFACFCCSLCLLFNGGMWTVLGVPPMTKLNRESCLGALNWYI